MDKKTIELISKVKIIIENNIKNNNNQEFYIEEQYYSDFDDGFLDINRLRLLGLLDNICMYLSSTLFNKNKNDTIDLRLYDFYNSNYMLAEYTITKKKLVIKQYIKFLKF